MASPNTLNRISRHLRLMKQARGKGQPLPTPPFLILFINSICNQKCDHCFYWESLNRKDDLSVDEMRALSESLGPIENLNLSGGEPFLRPEWAEICDLFIRNNGVKRIYTPTNGSFAEKTRKQLELLFRNQDLVECTIELSLDGLPAFHDEFRKMKHAFARAMETYDMLAEFQKGEPRLQIHSISTATGENVEDIKRLTTFLYERCPQMGHHNIAMLRGERKRPTLMGPELDHYRELVDYMASLWSERSEGRHGGVVEPMLHWGKERIAKEQGQAVPCKAGILTGVVYANGDVALCENEAEHPRLGNIRERPFPEIWRSEAAEAQRKRIACKECFCTNEVFLWPSIVFSPRQLARAYTGARAWKHPRPLGDGERIEHGIEVPPAEV